MKTIQFKSTPINWFKEFDGRKSNTVRKYDSDMRFQILDDWIMMPFHLNIEIINTQTGDTFTRTVKDVTTFDEYYIISW